MSDIKIFLASSIVELVHDRDAIGNFIRRINDSLRDRGGEEYVRLFLCEYEDASMSKLERKQEEYNRQIRSADLFVTLYFNHAGEFTLEELDMAAQSRRPEILAFFRTADDGQIPYEPDASLQKAYTRLTDYQIPWNTYQDVDQVKTQLLSKLQRYLPSNDGREG